MKNVVKDYVCLCVEIQCTTFGLWQVLGAQLDLIGPLELFKTQTWKNWNILWEDKAIAKPSISNTSDYLEGIWMHEPDQIEILEMVK